MEITKMVPVTIEVDDDDKRDCSGNCCFNVEGRYCARFDATTINGRNDGCIAEFGIAEFGIGESDTPPEDVRGYNHPAITSTPIGGTCHLFVGDRYRTYKVERDSTNNPYWCSEYCPFAPVAIDGCPTVGEDNPCALASEMHGSGKDVILIAEETPNEQG